MSKFEKLDAAAASKLIPIRLNAKNPYIYNGMPTNEGGKTNITTSAPETWLKNRGVSLENPANNIQDFDLKPIELRDGLIAFGGKFACIPNKAEDLDSILTRGQLWSGANSTIMPNTASQHHESTANLWNSNQDRLFIAAGYVLSKDGGWRQHSWCVAQGETESKIVEVTEHQQLYYGFVMSLRESFNFVNNNSFHGVDYDLNILNLWEKRFNLDLYDNPIVTTKCYA